MQITRKTYSILRNQYQQYSLVAFILLTLALATVGIDFLFAQFQNTSFYFSESLLFSSYWLLFSPLLGLQWRLYKRNQKFLFGFVVFVLATTIHLFCYPTLVWLLSKNLYYHTFPYWQTFDFGLTAYLLKTMIIYSLPLFWRLQNRDLFLRKDLEPIQKKVTEQTFIKSILVSEGNNNSIVLKIEDILYFSANSPYINIHHQSKKYLHTGTLKAILPKLDSQLFIRVHRSFIVNISKVSFHKSRLNGDYDLTLTDDTIIRLSRNYATDFKRSFEKYHHLTTE